MAEGIDNIDAGIDRIATTIDNVNDGLDTMCRLIGVSA